MHTPMNQNPIHQANQVLSHKRATKAGQRCIPTLAEREAFADELLAGTVGNPKNDTFSDVSDPRVVAKLDDGFLRLPNKLQEILFNFADVYMTRRQRCVFDAIVRKTYGFNKSMDWITSTQIKAMIAYKGCYRNICTDLRDLKARNILIQEGKQIGINPLLSAWQMRDGLKKEPEPRLRDSHVGVSDEASFEDKLPCDSSFLNQESSTVQLPDGTCDIFADILGGAESVQSLPQQPSSDDSLADGCFMEKPTSMAADSDDEWDAILDEYLHTGWVPVYVDDELCQSQTDEQKQAALQDKAEVDCSPVTQSEQVDSFEPVDNSVVNNRAMCSSTNTFVFANKHIMCSKTNTTIDTLKKNITKDRGAAVHKPLCDLNTGAFFEQNPPSSCLLQKNT